MAAPSRLAWANGFNATQEKAAIKIAGRLSSVLGAYVDPYSMNLYSAKGWWANYKADCQKFTGDFRDPNQPGIKRTIGCWYMTLTDIARGKKFEVTDRRGVWRADADFEIDPVPSALAPSAASGGEDLTMAGASS